MTQTAFTPFEADLDRDTALQVLREAVAGSKPPATTPPRDSACGPCAGKLQAMPIPPS